MPKQSTVRKLSGGKKRRIKRMTKEATAQLQAARSSMCVQVPSSADGTGAGPTPGPSSAGDASAGPTPASIPGPSSAGDASVTAGLTPGQQSPSVQQEVPVSASKRKLGYQFCSASDSQPADETLPSTICNLDCLRPLIEATLCPLCCAQTLTLKVDAKRSSGLSLCVVTFCTACDTEIQSVMTSKKLHCGTKVEDVNRRATAAACATGMGVAGLNNFCEIMNIPGMHHRTFNRHVKAIDQRVGDFSRESMQEAVKQVRRAYPEQAGQDIIDVHVSYDGSWHKRGYTSKNGLGAVIERKTGLVLDWEVLSSYCQVCETKGKELQGQNILMYEQWLADHKASGECNANYDGPSTGMEREAALRMWSRSIIVNGMRYISMISDGDAKTITDIVKMDPYPGIVVEKHECVNHVAKRLGSRLKKLVKWLSSLKGKDRVTLAGKGHGKLRPEVITKLQRYYTKAIRSNNTVPGMKKAIMAILDHCRSTENNQHHDNCPTGPDSWCFVQKNAALGLPIGSHADFIKTPLCDLVAENIRPIFEELSEDDLLKRCLLQATQNSNESLHSVIWARCPKHIFVCRPRLNIAVALGCCEYSWGSVATRQFLRVLNLNIGEETQKRGEKRDHSRLVKAESAHTEKAKRHRIVRADAKQRYEAVLLEKFGVLYGAGEGD